MSDGRVRVAVIFGGRSGEHSISCVSAKSVLSHLDPAQFDVVPIGITKDGAWLKVDPDIELRRHGRELPTVHSGQTILLPPDPTGGALVTVDGPSGEVSEALDIDVVFPLLHGPFGEDGTIQGMLELAGLPYVGPGVLASAAGMDKEFTKLILSARGLPVGRYVVLRPGRETLTDAEKADLGLPVFVKPARAGSSLGVSRVDSWDDLGAAITLARRADRKVLVEAAVIGREIECGVLEFPDGRIEASPTAEIHFDPAFSFYDFNAKYLDDVATFDIPAQLPDDVSARIRDYAVRAFTALDAQGLARVDFFLTATGDVIVNEVNTMPGFTPISMYPRMWAAAGIEYAELLATLIRTALARGVGLR